jgi:hypothetical protein
MKKKRILLVDDESDITAALNMALVSQVPDFISTNL